MTDPTNDIDALLRYLQIGHTPHWYDDSTRWHAALTALAAERDALKQRVAELVRNADELAAAIKQRDEARLQTGRLLNEIDCRIEHGADSNGHLEAIYNLFKEATDDR